MIFSRSTYHRDCHDGRIGYVNGASHIGAIALGSELDGKIRDVEAIKLVET